MAVWEFAIYILAPIAAVSEALILKYEGDWFWHLVVAGFVGFVGWLKAHAKDENADGIVDKFQEKRGKEEKKQE